MSIGVLKNGLGSLRNLHGLLASVRVGPRDLTSAVVELRNDCELLKSSLREVLPLLVSKGLSEHCGESLLQFVHGALEKLSQELLPLVSCSKLSVSQRLRLEPVVLAVVAVLEAAVPLLEDLTLGCAARVGAPGLAELVHEPGPWETAPALGHFRPVHLHVPGKLEGVDLGVDVRTARSLISLGLALVSTDGESQASSQDQACISVAVTACPGEVVTTIWVTTEPIQGAPVPWRTYARIEPTQCCALDLSRLSAVKFQHHESQQLVTLQWPGSSALQG